MLRKSRPTIRPEAHPVLVFPRTAFGLMQDGFAQYCNAGVEGCCFWYGPKTDAKEFTVTHVVFPKQINNRQNFTVPPDAVAEMSAATRPLSLINRAQVHTHPSQWVEHSPYDDEHAISRKALSIVLPQYGASIRAWPRGISVYEFRKNGWRRLSARQASQRIRIVDGRIHFTDLR